MSVYTVIVFILMVLLLASSLIFAPILEAYLTEAL